MDIQSTENILKCPKHPGFKIEFMQVNDLSQKQEKDILYCCCCQDEDDNYQQKNFLLIHKLLEDGNQKIVAKWPPLNDNNILQQLMNEMKEDNLQYSLIQKINGFFDEIIKDFYENIELCKKRMINHTLKQAITESQIIEQYQEISKIKVLRNTLLDEKTEIRQKQNSCRQLIKQMQNQKDKNSQVLSTLLKQHQELKRQIDFDYPNTIKNTITNLVDKINFFPHQFPSSLVKKEANTKKEAGQKMQVETDTSSQLIDQIMSLIGTKSNFCSDIFLYEMRSLLSSVHPMIGSLKNHDLFQPNKKPINFQQLRDYDLETIRKSARELSDKQTKEQPITFQQTLFNNDKQTLAITKNQMIKIMASKDTNYPGQCVSNIILDKEQKYIFRFKVNCSIDRVYFDIGLVRDSEKDKDGFVDCMTYSLLYSNDQITKSPFTSLSKVVQGKDFIVPTNSQLLELRLSLSDKIFEMVNYPNYDCKLTIEDYCKKNLNYYNLRLFIQTKCNSLEIILMDVFTVDIFQG